MVVFGSLGKPNHFGDGFIDIDYGVNLYASLLTAILGVSANTFQYIFKKADGGAVEYFYLLAYDIPDSAVR